MTNPAWPSRISRMGVTSFNKVNTADGYDFSMTVEATSENAVTSMARWNGTLYHRPWGTEWSANIDYTNVPPSQPLSTIMTSISVKIYHDGTADEDQRSVTVDITRGFQDGHERSTTKAMTLPAVASDRAPEDYIQHFTTLFGSKPYIDTFERGTE